MLVSEPDTAVASDDSCDDGGLSRLYDSVLRIFRSQAIERLNRYVDQYRELMNIRQLPERPADAITSPSRDVLLRRRAALSVAAKIAAIRLAIFSTQNDKHLKCK